MNMKYLSAFIIVFVTTFTGIVQAATVTYRGKPAKVTTTTYQGKTTRGSKCFMSVSTSDRDEARKSVTVWKDGISYSMRMKKNVYSVERDLMEKKKGAYYQYIGAAITIFRLGLKYVSLNIVEDKGTPLSYTLDAAGLFGKDISCEEISFVSTTIK